MNPERTSPGSQPDEDHTIGQTTRIRKAPIFHEPKCPCPVKYLGTVGIEPPKLRLGIFGNITRDMFELPKATNDIVLRIMGNRIKQVEIVKVVSDVCKINNLRRNDLRDLVLLWEFLSKNYALPRPAGSPDLTDRQKAFLDECEAFAKKKMLSIENIQHTVADVEARIVRFHRVLLMELNIIKSVCSEHKIIHGILTEIMADAARRQKHDDIIRYEGELPLSFISDKKPPEEKRPCDIMIEFCHRRQTAKAKYLPYGRPGTGKPPKPFKRVVAQKPDVTSGTSRPEHGSISSLRAAHEKRDLQLLRDSQLECDASETAISGALGLRDSKELRRLLPNSRVRDVNDSQSRLSPLAMVTYSQVQEDVESAIDSGLAPCDINAPNQTVSSVGSTAMTTKPTEPKEMPASLPCPTIEQATIGICDSEKDCATKRKHELTEDARDDLCKRRC